MSKENKIIKYGYQDEVDTLLDNGYSTYKVAEFINSKADATKKISHMVVQRYKDSMKERDMEQMIDAGEDPAEIIISDFRKGIRTNIKKVDNAIGKATIILEKLENSEDTSLQLKAIDTLIKALDQEKKSWLSLVQNGTRQLKIYGDVNIKKEQNIKLLLLSWSKHLCPECRKKISNVIEIKEDE